MKYNLSIIMTVAHSLRRSRNITMSEALRTSWAMAKLPKTRNEKAELTAAFMAKYPTGTIHIYQHWMGATVKFTATGNEYGYRGHGWVSRLKTKI